jgi:hypothetical protein
MLDQITRTSEGTGIARLPLRHDGSGIGPVLQYWDRLRQGRAIPARADLDPQALHSHIGQCAIVERPARGAVKLRLAGLRLQKLMGSDLRGVPVRSLFTLAHRDRLEGLLEEVFTGPRALTMRLSAAFEGQPLVMADMALLPLSDTRGAVTRALLVMTPQADPVGTPCRFHIRHATLGLIAPPTASGQTGPTRPALRVIQGGLA